MFKSLKLKLKNFIVVILNMKVYYIFVPDNTVYDIDRGSYFVSYNSFKQTRTPVLLMYYKNNNKAQSVAC